MTPTTQDAGHELLPCPFCGGRAGKPSVGEGASDERSGYNYTVTVMCSECGATKTVHSKRGKGGWCDENTEDTIQRAAAAWNTRPLADRLEALSQRANAEPEGWKLVPVEPTAEMVDAFIMDCSGTFEGAYAALLSTSPYYSPQSRYSRY
jgi:hypothetical protein